MVRHADAGYEKAQQIGFGMLSLDLDGKNMASLNAHLLFGL